MMSRFTLYDVHTHVHGAEYEKDMAEVISRAHEAGIGIINIGTDYESSQRAVEVAEEYTAGVYAAVGLHPMDNTKEVFDSERYKQLVLSSKKVVAVGECGLDYFRITNKELRIKQQEVFRQQIELAREVGKPLMIHCREAFPDLIKVLQENVVVAPLLTKDRGRGEVGVVHFFSGTIDDAQVLMDLRFSFSFGGVLTFTHDYDEVVRFIPLERILLETDAPYVAPVPHRGKRNEPAFVVEVAKKIAEIKGATVEEVARVSTKNAQSFFGI